MMGQTSGPITGENFTDQTWRDLFGAEPAIVGDVNGTSYSLTLPTSTDDVLLGSPSQDSLAVVAGKSHKIPAGETESLTIPPSSNVSVGRTDLIVLRFDPALSGDSPLGPVRLHRVAGVEGSSARPSYDGGPPGVEDLPLWAVTRKQGQSLNQAAARDLRVRSGPALFFPAGMAPSGDVPLGTLVRAGDVLHTRILNGSGSAVWSSVDIVHPKPRAGWANDYGVENPGSWNSDKRLMHFPIPTKSFRRLVTVTGAWDVEVDRGSQWIARMVVGGTGIDNDYGGGVIIASERLYTSSEGTINQSATITASFSIEPGENRWVRLWVFRISGTITINNGGGRTIDVSWVEHDGNDW